MNLKEYTIHLKIVAKCCVMESTEMQARIFITQTLKYFGVSSFKEICFWCHKLIIFHSNSQASNKGHTSRQQWAICTYIIHNSSGQICSYTMCKGLSTSASKTTDYVCLKIYLIFYVILSVLIDSERSHPVFQFSQAWEFIQVYNKRLLYS